MEASFKVHVEAVQTGDQHAQAATYAPYEERLRAVGQGLQRQAKEPTPAPMANVADDVENAAKVHIHPKVNAQITK
eukprot:6247399-Pyramimonas_sp.AAC.1